MEIYQIQEDWDIYETVDENTYHKEESTICELSHLT